MNMDYENVLQRLKEERVRNNLSQRQISYQMHMMQSHYSKAELGKKRFTFYEMQCLTNTEIDIQYMYTGLRSTKKYREFFEGCTFEEIICYISIFYSMAACLGRENSAGKWGKIYKRIEYMKFIFMTGRENDNIFFAIRQQLAYTQHKMAELLGVDIKKLRELENGRVLPDSEMLWKIYDLFHVPPSIILRDGKGLAQELCLLLEISGEEEGEAIFAYLQAGQKCLGEICEKDFNFRK